MAIEFFLVGLKKRLGGTGAARVIAALHQDEVIWEALQDEALGARVLEACGDQLEQWTPAAVALAALGQPDLIGTIASEPMKALESGLRQKAVRAYEDNRKKGLAPASLAEAGLLGLALRERRRLTGNWNGLSIELLTAPSGARSIAACNWKTALVCLAGFIPNFQELAQALVSRDAGYAGLEWLIHLFVTQPAEPLELGERIAQVLQGLGIPRQLDVLKALRQRGLQPAVEQAANLLIASQPQLAGRVDAVANEEGLLARLAEQVVTAQQLAAFHQLGGNPAQAEQALQSAQAMLKTIQTGLELQGGKLNRLNADANWMGGLVETLPLSGGAGKKMMKQVGLAVHANADEPFGAVNPAYVESDPFLMLQEAENQNRLGNNLVAAELARNAAEGVVQAIQKSSLYLGGDFEFSVNFCKAVRSLLNLNQPRSAAHVAEAAMKLVPADGELAGLAGQACAAEGALEQAREYATLAVYTAPGDLDQLRNLAKVCEASHDWPAAYQRRKECLAAEEDPLEDDQVTFARAALNADVMEEATESCEQVLAANPDQSDAHGILGLARAAQGRDEEAVLHLNRATLVAPEKDEWWLALANLHRKAGNRSAAVETLRAAVLAAPESGEIQYHLGELYLNDGLNSEALPYLRQAAALRPENPQVAFRLAKALHALGYLGEARQVLESMPDQQLANAEVSHEYAGIALALDDGDAALPAYERAVQASQGNPNWLREYAVALLSGRLHTRKLGEAQRYQRAESLLREALQSDPKDLPANLLLADALHKEGKSAEAYELYQELVERPEVVERGLLGEVQHGYGLAAIAMHQVEAGITMLREAANNLPADQSVVRDLAEACLGAQLEQDAGQYAEQALEMAVDDHDTLDWFSGLMVQLGKPERAAEALHGAIELSPQQGDLRVKYAGLALQAGNIEDARDALQVLPNLDLIDAGVLRQAAYLYLRMQEPQLAVDSLEKAVLVSDEPEPGLLFDLAKVYLDGGRAEDALEAIQRVPAERETAAMQVFQADLLAQQKRYQTAVLTIEKALKQAQGKEAAETTAHQLAGMFTRSANWLRELGDVSSAFEQAEKAVELEPDDLSLRFSATNLALALLANEKAAKYALMPFEAANRPDLAGMGVQLGGLSGHLSLQSGRLDEAQSLFDACAAIDPLDPWVESLSARLTARQGDLLQAAEIARRMITRIENGGSAGADLLLWIARTAFEAYLWQESFRLYDHLVTAYPAETRNSFELAKAMIEAGELQGMCSELDVQAHAPEVNGASPAVQERIGELLDAVAPALDAAEAARWQARAKWLKKSGELPELEGDLLVEDPMDAAALMAALRGTKNIPAAIQCGERFAEEAPVMVQDALCLAEEDLPAAVEKAAKLVNQTPFHPLYLALYARLAQKDGAEAEALQALEDALARWPEEAQWHAWAGSLAQRLGNGAESLHHWKQALALQPKNVNFAVEAGQALGQQGEYEAAAELLAQRIEEKPGDARLWLALADAQRGAGAGEAALHSALKASQVDGAQVDGLVYAAQICQEAGENEQALQYARAAYRAAPDDAGAIVNLSRILTAQDKAAESLELISQSIETLEPNLPLRYERAHLAYQLQGAEAAESWVDELVEEYPDDPEVLALHANVQADRGQLKSAERSAFRSLRLQPHQPALALALARMNRKAGQLDQAVHLLGQAATMAPDNAEIYLELGQTYLDRREDQQALEAFTKAIEADPHDARGYFQSALILKEAKDYPGAEDMLQKAARYAPDDLQIHRQLVGVMALNLIHKSQEASKA